MLQQQTIDTIKATVPALQEYGVTITKTFYKNMFSAHPELLNIFNHSNQEQGRQQTALANTVLAAAMHIDNLQAIVPTVIQIAHKHRSLGVLPEHYPIVGENLLKAIKEVLGDAATDEIIDAWAQAYGVIADIFIQVEEDLYKEAEQNEGWRLFKPFKIVRTEKESELVTSFYLAPVDGQPLPAYKAGQYVTVRMQIPGEKYLMNRQYTVSEANNQNEYRISVKHENDPKGIVSNYLHTGYEQGTHIDVSAPAGVFTLDNSDAPVLFVSGGIGVTPLNSMLQTIAERDVTFLQCARNKDVAAFTETIAAKVDEIGGTYKAMYSDEEGFVTKEQLEGLLKNDSKVYLCGPAPFMQHVINLLRDLNIPEENVNYEFFGPAMAV
ncbi:NO-inducible flavohemoprotein [Metasolibacillus sp.]|uniref:NO-inducible flavohemoprotein n=1 Tax=Metasolibacillus sp. TaxID=2703680 RepID=UPI0025D21DF3|nr:NO-inducible flavohemoprotein [Metasolibacillus sp.]MCT6922949.1 NO-inducible flavohemoprotein [Metasolibacillus sp.]MCT6939187.1 NO-inducible flavohemoprotein [Metasolibacillus sp.]